MLIKHATTHVDKVFKSYKDFNTFIKIAGKTDKEFSKRVLNKVASIPVIQADPDKFLFIRNRSISAMETYGQNQNSDAFPSKELQEKYSTFLNVRVSIDHKWEDDNDSIGLVVDSTYIPKQILNERTNELIPFDEEKLKVLNKQGDQPRIVGDYIENLLAIDKERAENKRPGLVTAIISGEVSDTSMGCFTKDTIITTNKGYKQISDIVEGDMVLTHTGNYQKVTGLFEKDFSEGIYNIRVQGLNEDFQVTHEHPFLTIRKDELDCIHPTSPFKDSSTCHPESSKNKQCINNHNCILSETRDYDINWVKTQDLKVGDFVAYPFNTDVEYDENESIEFARLLGYYLSDGNLSYNGYTKNGELNDVSTYIYLGINEREFVDDIINCCQKLFNYTPKVNISKEQNTYEVAIHNTVFGRKLYEYAGSGTWKKILSDKAMKWSPETQLHILGTFINGDGFQSDNSVFCETVNRFLIDQLKTIASRNRIIWTLQKQFYAYYEGGFNPPQGTTTWRLYFGKNFNAQLATVSQKVTYTSQSRWSNRKFYYKNYLFSKISKIEFDEEWYGKIYNFEVENDNSYVANDVAVHNCSVQKSECSVCHNIAETENEFCEHISYGKGRKFKVGKKEVIAYEINHGIEFFEDSIILSEAFAKKSGFRAEAGGEGADARAKIVEVIAGEKKVAKKTGTILDYIKADVVPMGNRYNDSVVIGEEDPDVAEKKEELRDDLQDDIEDKRSILKQSKTVEEFISKAKHLDDEFRLKRFWINANKSDKNDVLGLVKLFSKDGLDEKEILTKLEGIGYNTEIIKEALEYENLTNMDKKLTAQLKDFLVQGYRLFEKISEFDRGDNINTQDMTPLSPEINRYQESVNNMESGVQEQASEISNGKDNPIWERPQDRIAKLKNRLGQIDMEEDVVNKDTEGEMTKEGDNPDLDNEKCSKKAMVIDDVVDIKSLYEWVDDKIYEGYDRGTLEKAIRVLDDEWISRGLKYYDNKMRKEKSPEPEGPYDRKDVEEILSVKKISKQVNYWLENHVKPEEKILNGIGIEDEDGFYGKESIEFGKDSGDSETYKDMKNQDKEFQTSDWGYVRAKVSSLKKRCGIDSNTLRKWKQYQIDNNLTDSELYDKIYNNELLKITEVGGGDEMDKDFAKNEADIIFKHVKKAKQQISPSDEDASVSTKEPDGSGKVKKDTYKSDEKEMLAEYPVGGSSNEKISYLKNKINRVNKDTDELLESKEEDKEQFEYDNADKLSTEKTKGNMEKELKKKSIIDDGEFEYEDPNYVEPGQEFTDEDFNFKSEQEEFIPDDLFDIDNPPSFHDKSEKELEKYQDWLTEYLFRQNITPEQDQKITLLLDNIGKELDKFNPSEDFNYEGLEGLAKLKRKKADSSTMVPTDLQPGSNVQIFKKDEAGNPTSEQVDTGAINTVETQEGYDTEYNDVNVNGKNYSTDDFVVQKNSMLEALAELEVEDDEKFNKLSKLKDLEAEFEIDDYEEEKDDLNDNDVNEMGDLFEDNQNPHPVTVADKKDIVNLKSRGMKVNKFSSTEKTESKEDEMTLDTMFDDEF